MQELNEIQQLYNKIPKQVIAKFKTNLTEYESEQSEIDIPTDMDEAELNKLLKNLLENTVDQQTLDSLRFEFLVGDKLLRGELKSHIVRHDISCELTIQIEYFLAFQHLDEKNSITQDDWVSVLAQVPHPLGNLFMSGLFSGQVSLYSTDCKELTKLQLDDDAIKGLKVIPMDKENQYYVVSGGIGEEIKVSHLEIATGSDSNNKPQHKSKLNILSSSENECAIMGIDTNPIEDGHFCVSGQDGKVSIYKIPENFSQEGSGSNEVKKNKKKTHLNEEKSISFIAKEQIHQDGINSISWFSQQKIITGSQDHSMKMIDVEKLRVVGTVLTKDSITTQIYFSSDRLITGHEDGYIRLWDIRTPQVPVNTFKSHSKLVSSVQFHSKPHLFASGSYDTSIKVWDVRSNFPIQNIDTHHDKVFTVAWKNDRSILGGGSDSLVTVHGM